MGPALLPFSFGLFGGRGSVDEWRSEVNLAKMVISSHPVGSTVIKFGGKVTPPTEPPQWLCSFLPSGVLIMYGPYYLDCVPHSCWNKEWKFTSFLFGGLFQTVPLCSSDWTGTRSINQAMLLPQLLEGWDYGGASPYPAESSIEFLWEPITQELLVVPPSPPVYRVGRFGSQ